jgi:hypothetical protein
MSLERITLATPIEKIARHIAEDYLRRPFPKNYLPDGLLDYTKIRNQAINPNEIYRPIHGYQNASRVAALIPQLLAFYQRHIDELIPKLQEQLKKDILPETIKKFQIVALLRAVGRTQDTGHGDEFAEQGKKECLAYLGRLGVKNATEREELASMIVDCEGSKEEGELSLGTILLAEATLLETFRDGTPYDDKNIYLDYCPFFHMLARPRKLKTIKEFIQFCTTHAQVIYKQQGFLFSALKFRSNQPIHSAWPVDAYSWLLQEQKWKGQVRELEYRPDCFEQCQRDVDDAFKFFWECIEYDKPSNIMVMQTSFQQQQAKLAIDFLNPAAFMQALIEFFKPFVESNEIVTDGSYVFRLDWNSVQLVWSSYYNGNEFVALPPLDLRAIFSKELIKQENEDALRFIDRVCSYFADKIGRTLFVAKDEEVELLSWPAITSMIELILQAPNIEAVWEEIFKRYVLDLVKSKKNSGSSEVLTFSYAKEASQAAKYLTLFSEKYYLKESIHYQAGDTTLQLSEKFWIKYEYRQREFPENMGNRYVIKVLGADRKRNTVDFFLDGILPKGERLYQDIRPPLKKRYTLFARRIVKRKSKEPMYLPEIKEGYSPIQSLTLLNAKATTDAYTSSQDKDAPNIGVAITESDILLNRLFTYEGMGDTVSRKVDAQTWEDAQRIYALLTENLFGISKEEVAKFKAKINKNTQLNEVLARAKWNPESSKILIFADKFRSRVYAQDLAQRIKERLVQQGNVTDDFQVPILFYLPNDECKHLAYYTQAMQQKDKEEAKRQYYNRETDGWENDKNDAYEFLLMLAEEDLAKALSQSRSSLLYQMLDKGYIGKQLIVTIY